MSLADELSDALGAMTWLKPSDGAAVALAALYAEQIDTVVAEHEVGSQELTKALYLGPHLLNTLRALGGAPAERKALGAEEAVGGKLAQLRAVSKGA